MTKQEQIEEMAHYMCEYYNRGFCANGDMTEICEDMPDCCYKNDAEALYDVGYGDVSEYKAEIERLKDDYAKLQEQFADYQIASDKEIVAQAKQAKIDVLNELKTHSYFDDYYIDGYVFVSDIDKLIEEVQNEQKDQQQEAKSVY